MAAPEYVPVPPDDKPRVYHSAPWSEVGWVTERPSTVEGPWPRGPRLGDPGPDPGYALKLAKRFTDRLVLADGEDRRDVTVGCVQVALKRSSLFGRGPVITDLEVAFTVWGFLADADPGLVALRKPLFAAVSVPNHYMQRRDVAAAVPAATLRLTPAEVNKLASTDWRGLLAIR